LVEAAHPQAKLILGALLEQQVLSMLLHLE